MINYNPDQRRKIEYLLRRMGELKNGHTLSAQYSEGYPFCSYVDRYGKITVPADQLKDNFIYKYLRNHPEIAGKVDLVEVAWEYFLVYGTPNGDLFKNNKCFETIGQGRGLTLIHCTSSLKEISASGLLYPSGGCLGASLYSVPLRADGRVHNLTKFLMDVEMPFFLRGTKRENSPIEAIAIHLESENFIHSNEESNGMDYMLMGDLLYEVYGEFREWYVTNFGRGAVESLEAKLLEQVRAASGFLNLCADYKMDDLTETEFVEKMEEALEKLPFLGYLYFETLSEFITLFQDDDVSQQHKEMGELYNVHFKQMIFDLSPVLAKGFKLTQFRPKVADVVKYLEGKTNEGKIFSYFDRDKFLHFLKWRFAQYVRHKMLRGKYLCSLKTFGEFEEKNSALLGHLAHRELKSHAEISQVYPKYEDIKSKIIWNEWVSQHVVYPFNSIIPKGEVGINPGYPHLDYKIHHITINNQTGEIKLGKRIMASLAYEMAKPEMYLMKARIGSV